MNNIYYKSHINPVNYYTAIIKEIERYQSGIKTTSFLHPQGCALNHPMSNSSNKEIKRKKKKHRCCGFSGRSSMHSTKLRAPLDSRPGYQKLAIACPYTTFFSLKMMTPCYFAL